MRALEHKVSAPSEEHTHCVDPPEVNHHDYFPWLLLDGSEMENTLGQRRTSEWSIVWGSPS